jgi:hypothetical protein
MEVYRHTIEVYRQTIVEGVQFYSSKSSNLPLTYSLLFPLANDLRGIPLSILKYNCKRCTMQIFVKTLTGEHNDIVMSYQLKERMIEQKLTFSVFLFILLSRLLVT